MKTVSDLNTSDKSDLHQVNKGIPPPRRHQVRYHGVYAPNSRFQVVVKRMTLAGEEALRRQQSARRRVAWVLWGEL